MQKIYTIYVLKDSILKEKFVIGSKIYDRVTRQIPPPGGGKPPPNWPNPWPPTQIQNHPILTRLGDLDLAACLTLCNSI